MKKEPQNIDDVRLTLSEYIQHIGIEDLADEIGTSVSTVKAWRYYARVPRIKQSKMLMQLSKGVLTWESIYGLTKDINNDRAIR
jgi:hypothetical protein